MAKKKEKKQPPKKELLKLDLGSGQNKREGFTGVDIAKAPGVDIVADLFKFPWPFEDNSVSEAHCSHFIEHIPMEYVKGKDMLFCFFDELYRILVPGGKCSIIAPYYANMRCWQDPTHRRAITDATFFYVSKEWRKVNKLDHYQAVCDFEAVWGYAFDPAWANRSEDARQFAIRHYWNVVQDIHVTLTKK